MDNQHLEEALGILIDKLAAIEHQRWAHWQRYLHDQGVRLADGSLVLPARLVEKWDRQIETDYKDLAEREKESDREQVRRYLPIIASVVTNMKL